jgi:acylphosphatase
MVRRRVVVRGRVQGVFFRDSLRREAVSAGVAGWVRNCRDGSVEAVLEGPNDAVEEVLRFASEGPPRASVTNVETFDEEPEGLRGFEIR